MISYHPKEVISSFYGLSTVTEHVMTDDSLFSIGDIINVARYLFLNLQNLAI